MELVEESAVMNDEDAADWTDEEGDNGSDNEDEGEGGEDVGADEMNVGASSWFESDMFQGPWSGPDATERNPINPAPARGALSVTVRGKQLVLAVGKVSGDEGQSRSVN